VSRLILTPVAARPGLSATTRISLPNRVGAGGGPPLDGRRVASDNAVVQLGQMTLTVKELHGDPNYWSGRWSRENLP
jgi:hypothetical protein